MKKCKEIETWEGSKGRDVTLINPLPIPSNAMRHTHPERTILFLAPKSRHALSTSTRTESSLHTGLGTVQKIGVLHNSFLRVVSRSDAAHAGTETRIGKGQEFLKFRGLPVVSEEACKGQSVKPPCFNSASCWYLSWKD